MSRFCFLEGHTPPNGSSSDGCTLIIVLIMSLLPVAAVTEVTSEWAASRAWISLDFEVEKTRFGERGFVGVVGERTRGTIDISLMTLEKAIMRVYKVAG